ncbi:hypothetical protein CEXT_259081 [Caerostris extrusa]|uniref:Uncharacterized protein n=1 Tax=Caerostris extrusa TaxID=172846 RepID=A0AAV4SV21_CAEEX|nr:hypothetical protein CEXT_259081 [Caerostris extrusa]
MFSNAGIQRIVNFRWQDYGRNEYQPTCQFNSVLHVYPQLAILSCVIIHINVLCFPYPPTYQPAYLSTRLPSIHLPTYLPAMPTYLPACLPTHLTNPPNLPTYLYLPTCTYLPACIPTYLPAYTYLPRSVGTYLP